MFYEMVRENSFLILDVYDLEKNRTPTSTSNFDCCDRTSPKCDQCRD